ncbi:hypothetical protein FFF34_012240 [Inquilinus sp. KBS0705]|nr:hypothetical protein FFF34_012240 [Inquilinus sp. KBS0705]
MKLIIKHIGLLIFSGLILPFYYYVSISHAAHQQRVNALDKQTVVEKPVENGFSIYSEVAKIAFPVLKSLF